MRHRIVIALNSLKIFNKIFLIKKSFFVEFDILNYLKINIIFYKMNTMNAHCILRDTIISIVFAIVFFVIEFIAHDQHHRNVQFNNF